MNCTNTDSVAFLKIIQNTMDVENTLIIKKIHCPRFLGKQLCNADVNKILILKQATITLFYRLTVIYKKLLKACIISASLSLFIIIFQHKA